MLMQPRKMTRLGECRETGRCRWMRWEEGEVVGGVLKYSGVLQERCSDFESRYVAVTISQKANARIGTRQCAMDQRVAVGRWTGVGMQCAAETSRDDNSAALQANYGDFARQR